jgi:hypothetical protein
MGGGGGGGAQRSALIVYEPKETGARSFRACSAAVHPKPTSINVSLEFQNSMARRRVPNLPIFAMLGISSCVSIAHINSTDFLGSLFAILQFDYCCSCNYFLHNQSKFCS